jgi:hypothetical protein
MLSASNVARMEKLSSTRAVGRKKRNHQIHGMKSLSHLQIKYVHRFRDRHGKIRHYFRSPGRKRVSLPGLPGSTEFMEAYAAALAGETAPRIEVGTARSKPGSVAAAVAVYFGSMAFGNLAPETKRTQRYILERFREVHGEKSFRRFERKHIEAMLAEKITTPHAARSFLKVLRAVIAIAIAAGLRDDDPTIGIRNIKLRATGGFRTWAEEDIAQFEAAHPDDSRARLAFALLLYTGQRRADVIRMSARPRRIPGGAPAKDRRGFANPAASGLAGNPDRASGGSPDLSHDQSGRGVPGAGLYKLVPRCMPRRWPAGRLIGARLAQGYMPTACRGRVLGQSNRCGFRSCHITGGRTLHESRRPETHGNGRNGSHNQNQNENWQTCAEG